MEPELKTEEGNRIIAEESDQVKVDDINIPVKHYAHISNGVVDSVIVIDAETLQSNGGWPVNGVFKPLSEWIETNIDTERGSHKKDGEPIRKNYAGIGYEYDAIENAFIPPHPGYASWTFNKKQGIYEAPIPKPNDGQFYTWNEDLLTWEIT